MLEGKILISEFVSLWMVRVEVSDNGVRSLPIEARNRNSEEIFLLGITYIDGLSASTIVVGEISSLAHEFGNHTVEARSGISESLLTGAESTEVFGSPRHNIGTQFHHNTTSILAADGHIEVNFRVGPAFIFAMR